MVVQPRPGWRDPGHRPRRPAHTTTAPRPPGGAVVASLRGAVHRRACPAPPSWAVGPRRDPAGSWWVRECGRSDSGPVRTTHVHLAGRAELPPLADEDLVERARTDPDAFAELYRRYVNRVHAFVYRRSRSTEIADEITSATFERALRALPGFRWREGGFQAWIYRIAANELASHYRKAQRQHSERGQRAARQLHEASTTVEHPLDNDDGDLVLQALGRLNERYQRAITLRYLTGLSPEEAAHAMGLNKATLAVVLHRALGALRKAMHELERDAPAVRGGRRRDGAPMRRAELRDELERLGSRPVPLPDPRRVDAIEDRLYQELRRLPAPSVAALQRGPPPAPPGHGGRARRGRGRHLRRCRPPSGVDAGLRAPGRQRRRRPVPRRRQPAGPRRRPDPAGWPHPDRSVGRGHDRGHQDRPGPGRPAERARG